MPDATSTHWCRHAIAWCIFLTLSGQCIFADEPNGGDAGPVVQKPAAQGRVAMQQMEVDDAPARGRGQPVTAPYLGVSVAPIDEQLHGDLKLPDELGLVVEEVDAESPARRGGVRRLDVLRKFNDQILCSPDQLETLVKTSGKGARIRLTVLRGGREKAFMVTLGEREVRPDVLQQNQGGPLAGFPQLPPQFRDLMARGGLLNQPGQGGVNATSSQFMSTVADQRGTVEVHGTNGKRSVVIKERSGKVVYEGPVNSPADLKKVPAAFRDMVERAGG